MRPMRLTIAERGCDRVADVKILWTEYDHGSLYHLLTDPELPDPDIAKRDRQRIVKSVHKPSKSDLVHRGSSESHV